MTPSSPIFVGPGGSPGQSLGRKSFFKRRYRVRLTGQAAETAPVGQLAKLERWIEFVQGDAVKGRAMAPVVPSRAVPQVAESRPPAQGRFRVERLKQDDYLRLWYNLGGDQILIYLPIVPRAPAVERRGR